MMKDTIIKIILVAFIALESVLISADINLNVIPEDRYPQEDLQDSLVFESVAGILDVTFRAKYQVGDPNGVYYYGKTPVKGSGTVSPFMYEATYLDKTYPLQFPAPTFKLNRGDKFKITLINEINGTEEIVNDMQFGFTNIHLHGFFAPDEAQGDNVFRANKPEQNGTWKLDVDVNVEQPDGYFWYHAHVHTQTTPQVFGGFAGAIIVGDPIKFWPLQKKLVKQENLIFSLANIQPPAFSEGIFFLGFGGNDDDDDGFSEFAPVKGATSMMRPWYENFQFYVNGQANAVLKMEPGETRVLNLVNVSPQGFVSMCITDIDGRNPFTGQILVIDGQQNLDGVLVEPVQPWSLNYTCTEARSADSLQSIVWLGPGNRKTISIVAPAEEGTFYISSVQAPGGASWPEAYSLLTIQVASEDSNKPIPEPVVFDNLGLYDINSKFLEEPNVYREYLYTNGACPTCPFLINGEVFPDLAITRMECGTLEEWLNFNGANASPGRNAGSHAYHIHQTSYLVTKINGTDVDPNCHSEACDPNGVMSYVSQMDVTNFPPQTGFTMRYRVPDFPGKLVFHCHVLGHEDLGMMNSVLFWRPIQRFVVPWVGLHGEPLLMNGDGDLINLKNGVFGGINTENINAVLNDILRVYQFDGFRKQKDLKKSMFLDTAYGHGNKANPNFFDVIAISDLKRSNKVDVYHQSTDHSLSLLSSFKAFDDFKYKNKSGKKKRKTGVSVAVGHFHKDHNATIAVASQIAGTCNVKLLDENGNTFFEMKDAFGDNKILPGGCNVAVGDVNGDNFNDLVIGAGKGAAPEVIAFDGQDVYLGLVPQQIFRFRAAGTDRAGVKIAIGYVSDKAPNFNADIITTPISGNTNRGVVQVWKKEEFNSTVNEVLSFPPFAGIPLDKKLVKKMPLTIKSGFYGQNLEDASAIFTYYLPNQVAITSINGTDASTIYKTFGKK